MTKLSDVIRRRADVCAAGCKAAVVAGALVLGLACTGAAVPAWADEPTPSPDAYAVTDAAEGVSNEGTAQDVLDGDITLAERIAAQVLPSVGSVYAFVDNGYSQGMSQGSCEVLTEDGYVLTNNHVVSNSFECYVVLGGEVYAAQVVGADPTSDVAVLKIEPGDVPFVPIKVGDSAQARLGQWVMTIGTPYGESESVSAGIISGLGRTTAMTIDGVDAYYVGLIQTDAMINSGSSGGALVNAAGEFIGMTTLSAGSSGDWAGMTYAIPSNYALQIADQLIATGVAEHPRLGANVVGLFEAYSRGLYNIDEDGSLDGVYVASVNAGSCAEAAGLQAGDILLAVDGNEVYSADGLIIELRAHAVGEPVTLTVMRGGETLQLEAVLDSDIESDVADGADTGRWLPLGGVMGQRGGSDRGSFGWGTRDVWSSGGLGLGVVEKGQAV